MADPVRIEGLDKLHREFKAISKELPKELKAVSKAGAEIVADEGRVRVPVLTGKLRAAIKAGATAKGGIVRVKLDYAPPIHFGWTAHNIDPDPFLYDALDDRREEVTQIVNDGVRDLVEKTFHDGLR